MHFTVELVRYEARRLATTDQQRQLSDRHNDMFSIMLPFVHLPMPAINPFQRLSFPASYS